MRGLSHNLGSLLFLGMLRVTVSVRYLHASPSWRSIIRLTPSERAWTSRPTGVFHRAAFSLERQRQRQLHCRGGESDTVEAPPSEQLASERVNETATIISNHTQHDESAYNVSSSSSNISAVEQPNRTNNVFVPAWKRELPSPLCDKGPKTLQKLLVGHNVEIYLLGTAHVSNDSSSDVQLLLNAVGPDAIFVELCESRISLLEGTDNEESANTNTNTNTTTTITNNSTSSGSGTDIGFWDRIRAMRQEQGGSVIQALSSVLLTSVQEDYASELGVELGGEFRAAYRYWQQQQQQQQQHGPERATDTIPNLILGDRPLHVTLIRAWESLWWWPKVKVMAGLVWSSWQKPDKEELIKWLESVRREESDVLTESLNELCKHFPTLHTCIIEERDAWLAAKLVQSCQALSSRQGSRKQIVVAIVGAGHVPGISEWLVKTNATETPEQVLSRLVTTRRFSKDPAAEQMAASWVKEVTELQNAPDSAWTWAQQQQTALDDINT
jgi:pheromone shutdown protein TraB